MIKKSKQLDETYFDTASNETRLMNISYGLSSKNISVKKSSRDESSQAESAGAMVTRKEADKIDAGIWPKLQDVDVWKANTAQSVFNLQLLQTMTFWNEANNGSSVPCNQSHST